MSFSLILGLLVGLAVGGPLYLVYKTFTAKRKQVARKQIEKMMRKKREGQEK